MTRNAATALATTVLEAWVARGLTEVVVCPGSRSAPLAFAAHRLADAGRVRLHTRVDERTAGFLALGLAKSSRRPVAVVTTSGTAVGHLHPAVLEAAHAGVRLVALTADRPAALRGSGANQTADFLIGFGPAVRHQADVPPGCAGGEAEQVAAWRGVVAAAAQALEAAPGPVHMNLQFAEPLVPDAADGWTHPADASGVEPVEAPPSLAEPVETPAEPVVLSPDPVRTVVVAGDDAGPPARLLAERGGWPLLAEPSSGSRTGDHAIRTYRLLLSDPGLADRVERVVVAGHPTLSRPVARLLSRDDLEVVRMPARGRLDVRPAPPGEWFAEWAERDRRVSAALDALLAASPRLLPHQVAGAVARALPPGGLLYVGASNPIRDLDLMVPRYDVGARRLVLANRGLSGIDGTVSSAIGAALARPHTSRALALMGDVTFLHDANGLVLGPDEARPDLTIVVLDDDGGGIFATLEQGAPPYAETFERLFGTPHGTDLASLCAAHRIPHLRVRSLGELEAALGSPHGGIEVIQAVVDRSGRRDLDTQIRGLGTTSA